MNKIIENIDKKCSEGRRIMGNIVYDLTKNINKKRKLCKLIKLADRYACLLDFYYETNDIDYYKDAKKQKKALYRRLDAAIKTDLTNLEKELLPYFNYEQDLRRKIQTQNPITEKEIKNYILKKSSDSFYYMRILQAFIPKDNNLVKAYHYRIALYDILDDLRDFEEDFKQKMPNILYLYLYNQNPNVPSSRLNAFIVAKNSGIDRRIIKFACELRRSSDKLNPVKYPLLNKSVERNYQKIVKLFTQ